MNEIRVTVNDGKYEVIIKDGFKMEALRHGEPWQRNLVGDNLVFHITNELYEARQKITKLEAALNQVRRPDRGKVAEVVGYVKPDDLRKLAKHHHGFAVFISLLPRPEWVELTAPAADSAATEQAEKLGDTCIDGGKCHHACTEKCFRRECCAPFSGYKGPWIYAAAPASADVGELLRDDVLAAAAKAVEDSAEVWTGFAMSDAKTCIRAALQASSAAVPHDEDAATRLRVVADKLGLKDAIPAGNAELWQCAFAVLGMIRRKVEELQAKLAALSASDEKGE